MSKIRFLQVKYGDAFIIECSKDDKKGVIVVDGGPGSCRVEYIKKLKEYESIDLLVLTHFDEDHIGGVLSYIKAIKDSDPFPVKEMWVNNCLEKEVVEGLDCSYGQAKKLADILTEISQRTRLIWQPYISEGYKHDYDFATVEVISPTPGMQEVNIKEYAENVGIDLSAKDRANEDLKEPMKGLSERPKKEPDLEVPNELANAASIAFILRCEGLSVLMLGDCYPQNVEAYLRANGYHEKKLLEVDYVKVSHHGSRNNICNSLLDIIKCNKFIISTNGGLGSANHPDREAIANILCHPQRDINDHIDLYFNYPEDIIITNGTQFLKDEDKQLNFTPHYNITEIPCQ